MINPPGVIECPTMRLWISIRNVLLIEGRHRRYLDLTILCVTISSAVIDFYVCKQECLSFALNNDNKSLYTGLDEIARSGHQFEMCIHSHRAGHPSSK